MTFDENAQTVGMNGETADAGALAAAGTMTDTGATPDSPAPAAKSSTMTLPVRVGAELLGTFLVCFAVYMMSSLGTAIYGINLAYIALGTGLAYAAVTLLFGHISGAQLNPAVTVASMLAGPTKILDGILYIIAQLVGALAAGALIVWLVPTSEQIGYKQWLTTTVNGFDKGSAAYSSLAQYGLTFGIALAIAVEVVATLIVVGAAVRTERAKDGTSTKNRALAMGLAYGVGAAIAYPVTGASLNPARATGIAVFAQNKELSTQPLQQAWVFWLASILAAALVALAIIVMQMASTPKHAVAPVIVDDADDADGADATDDLGGEAVAEESEGNGTNVPAAASGDEADGQVSQAQANAQAQADEGIERH